MNHFCFGSWIILNPLLKLGALSVRIEVIRENNWIRETTAVQDWRYWLDQMPKLRIALPGATYHNEQSNREFNEKIGQYIQNRVLLPRSRP